MNMKKFSLYNNISRLKQNRVYTLINIGGVVLGIAVSLFLGLLIKDEAIATDVYKKQDVVVTGIQCKTFNGDEKVENIITIPAAEELRISFGSNFQFVILASQNDNQLLTKGNNKIRYKVINPSLAKN